MEQKNLDSETIISPNVIYPQDDTFKFNVNEFTFNEGGDNKLKIKFMEALHEAEDTSINKHTNFVLTSKLKMRDVGHINTKKVPVPDVFISYLKFENVYLGIANDNRLYKKRYDIINVRPQIYTKEQNECYFTISLNGSKTCNIYHFDGFENYYMNVVNGDIYFTNYDPKTEPLPDTTTFNYILDKNNSKIILMAAVDGVNYILTYNTGDDDVFFADIPQNSISQNNAIIDIRYREWSGESISLKHRWNSYSPNLINTNQLEIDRTKSYEDLECNNLLQFKYELFDGNSIPVDFVTLKNQLTSEHLQSRNNPFHQFLDVDLRDYNKIYTGTNQIGGNDKISLGYENFTRNIKFKPGSLTHFHMPQDMYPYERINIKDSGLIEAGAIGSTSPLWSDKIFKKAASYKESSHFGNITGFENGEYLCSWLRYNSITGTYQWVDRFYDIERASVSTALSAANFKSPMDGVVDFTEDFIFDKTSELTLEPGALYAYYRVGPQDVQNIVSSFPNHIQEDLSTYKLGTGATKLPDIVDDNKVYTFDGESLGRSKAASDINKSADITLNFDISSDDWTKPLGHRIIDNYTHKGISIYNKRAITPFIVIPDENDLKIYNSNLTLLSNPGIPALSVEIHEPLENMYVVESKDNSIKLHTVDIFGNIVKSIDVPNNISLDNYHFSASDIYAFFNCKKAVDDDDLTKVNILIIPLSSDGNTREDFKLLSADIDAVKGFSESLVDINSLSDLTTEKEQETVFNVFDISNTSQTIRVGTGTSTDVDIHRNSWEIRDGGVFKYDGIANYQALSTEGSTIKKVKSDIYGNVWVLHGNQIAKITNDRKFIFNNALSTYEIPIETISNTKAIDFIREFESGELKEYCIIINQDGTTVHIHYFDMDGQYVKTNKINEEIKRDLGSDDITTFTGYDYVKKKYHKETTENKLFFKHRQINPTNSADYIDAEFEIDISKFTSAGWQNFIYNCNVHDNVFNLRVNNINHQFKPPDDKKLKRTDDTITTQLYIGTGAIPGNIDIQTFLKQPLHYLGTNFKIKNFHLFNDSLRFFDLNYLYRLSKHIESINWQVPGGGRQFIDTIDYFFKHRHPGYKTNLFELVNIIEKEAATDEVKSQIAANINEFVPVNSKLQKTTWLLN